MISTALGALLHQPREFLGNQFVYAVITSRARGLSVGVNMNPDQNCNFNCAYCEVQRIPEKAALQLDLKILTQELLHVLGLAYEGRLRELEQFANVPPELLALKEVALSGDGEPTLVPNFDRVMKEVFNIRRLFSRFKLVLITNGTGLDRPAVKRGLEQLLEGDEIWIKLDAGTERFMHQVNGTRTSIEVVLRNILTLARTRPVVIQSLFCLVDGCAPSDDEVEAYVQRLAELKADGAQIALVQIYSVSRTPAHPGCKHLPLARLSQIARKVRMKTGLVAEVF